MLRPESWDMSMENSECGAEGGQINCAVSLSRGGMSTYVSCAQAGIIRAHPCLRNKQCKHTGMYFTCFINSTIFIAAYMR